MTTATETKPLIQTKEEPYKPTALANFPPEAIAEIVRQSYRRVLEREVDDSGFVTYSADLLRGDKNVQQLIETLGKSDEYGARFVYPYTMQQIAILMYKHFLARDPENQSVIDNHAASIAQNGWRKEVDRFVYSPEYESRFGKNAVPR